MSTQKASSNDTIKDPAEWTTGDEPMTGAQDSYLHTLARRAGEEVDNEMSKAEASIKINELREKTGLESPRPKGRQTRRK
jgi:hypothetical protein